MRTSTHRSPARFIARTLPGAKPVPMPALSSRAFRFCVRRCRGAIDGFTKSSTTAIGPGASCRRAPDDFTRRGQIGAGGFRSLADALTTFLRRSDPRWRSGCARREGIASFSEIQAELGAGRSDRMLLYVFDILYLDGFDLRSAPLIERKRVLAEFLKPVKAGPIQFSEHLDADGETMFEHACAMGLEGIVSKLSDAPYRSGPSDSWIKVKCTQREVLTIIGFVPKPNTVAALHLARRVGKDLVYAGKAGTGFTMRGAAEVRAKLDPLVTPRQPLSTSVRGLKGTWVKPMLEAEIEHRGITGEGLLRAAVFKGVQEAKAARRAR